MKAEFTTKSGKNYTGLCSPAFNYHFGEIQPYMFTEIGSISFWSGMLEPQKKLLDDMYAKLGESGDTLFPISFKALTPVKGAKLEGKIPGFLWRPLDKDEVIIVK